MTFANPKQNITAYVKGKTWYWYIPLWVLSLYAFVEILQYDPNEPLPLIVAIPQSFDFFLHEMAHIVTAFLPAVLTASAGSLSEILLGTTLIYTAFRTRGYFASVFCFLWFMLACQSAGTYMADARSQKLALVSLGAMLSGSDETIHDWHFVFGKLHILALDKVIGYSVRSVGVIAGLFGLAFSAWIIYQMAAASGTPQPAPGKETALLKATKAEIAAFPPSEQPPEQAASGKPLSKR
jgi:hypothetical protein